MPNYAKELNQAQYEAVTSGPGATLVVAGAGSGKTRTIVYRLAWLCENGVNPSEIALLTFTRKAAANMLQRAALMHTGEDLSGINGGTFHSFAFGILRRWQPDWLDGRPFTLMDPEDVNHALKRIKEQLNLGKKDSSFPKIQTIASILGKARNKELPIDQVLQHSAWHLLPHAGALEEMAFAYRCFRRQNALLDYDDLLFELEEMLKNDEDRAARLRGRFGHILVDEYQDTNLVQARIVRQLAMTPDGKCGNIMVVGDEAQSIYAFRGANVRNILEFPYQFPDCRIIRLEENYRSTKPVLDVANDLLSHAVQSFDKHLFTKREGGEPVRLLKPLSDTSEAGLVAGRVRELLAVYEPDEIAVLFRAGFHSYALEAELRKLGIGFRKYGGMRFVEAAHIKDVLAFARLAINPLDLPAFTRLAEQCRGIGAKTADKLYKMLAEGKNPAEEKAFRRFPQLAEDLLLISDLRKEMPAPRAFFEKIIDWYQPRLELLYPEDWPRRSEALGEILQIAQNYRELDLFVADIALENPDDNPDQQDCVTLSTIHSAKGLEWNAVLILDLVEDRFPGRHASARPEDFEEERRLLYVALTRARKTLELYSPATLYSRLEYGMSPVNPSPFVRDLKPDLYQLWKEVPGGGLVLCQRQKPAENEDVFPESEFPDDDCQEADYCDDSQEVAETEGDEGPGKTGGYCNHRIFGRGKIVKFLEPGKVQVKFPGFGLKVILTDYLVMED